MVVLWDLIGFYSIFWDIYDDYMGICGAYPLVIQYTYVWNMTHSVQRIYWPLMSTTSKKKP